MIKYGINASMGAAPAFYFESNENIDKILKAVEFSGGCASLIQILLFFSTGICSNECLERFRRNKVDIASSKANNRLEEAICLFCQIIFSDKSEDISKELEKLKYIILSAQDTPAVYFAISYFFGSVGYDTQVIKLVTHMAGYLEVSVSDDPDYQMLRQRFIKGVNNIQVPVSTEMVNYIHDRLS